MLKDGWSFVNPEMGLLWVVDSLGHCRQERSPMLDDYILDHRLDSATDLRHSRCFICLSACSDRKVNGSVAGWTICKRSHGMSPFHSSWPAPSCFQVISFLIRTSFWCNRPCKQTESTIAKAAKDCNSFFSFGPKQSQCLAIMSPNVSSWEEKSLKQSVGWSLVSSPRVCPNCWMAGSTAILYI